MAKRTLRTPICDMLGIEYPIIQAGMGYAAGPELVAAVSNAGGLGTLGADVMDPEDVRIAIRKVKSLTDKPFVVDLVFPARAVEDPATLTLPDPPPAPVLQVRRELEEKGVDIAKAWTDYKGGVHIRLGIMKERFEVILEEGAPVFASGLGTPQWVIDECHRRGMIVICLVGRVKDALRVEAMGADIIVAQGHEAGGHTGRIANFVLIPQVVDAVKVPVLAAGGIMDGRGLVASLAFGAQGVWVGTRFIPTFESSADPEHKAGIIAGDENATVWSRAFDGFGHRHLKTRVDEIWEGHEHEILPHPIQNALMAPLLNAGRGRGLPAYMHMSTGQGAGLVNRMQSAKEVVDEMVDSALKILKERFPQEISLD